MNIINKESYSNFIYTAVVVNSKTEEGPTEEYKIQIYIPQLQFELDDVYEDYMNSGNKATSEYKDRFPWAKSLVKDLKEGNVVYGSFINNDNGDFIILGLDAYNPKNQTSGDNNGDGYNVTGSGLLDITMPIIIHHEVGLPVDAWPDGITDSQYGNINPNDNGSWSLGLIQWNKSRAYNLLLSIREADGTWENSWTDKSDQLFNDLKSSNRSNASKYGQGYTLTRGTAKYNSIKSMLTTSSAKETQRKLASEDTQSSLEDLQKNYGIQNPAVLIFIADIMNQYGPGVANTKSNAGRICKGSGDMMSQFEEVIKWCQSNIGSYYTYKNRREGTISYIRQLNEQGKLNTAIGGTAGNGQYCIPFKGSSVITSGWGAHGYPSSKKPHAGIDFAGMEVGRPILACTSGQATYKSSSSGFGKHVMLQADDGNLIVFGHMSAFEGSNRKVNRGDVIGYVGSTGNSTGPHLHLGITKHGESGLWNANWSSSEDPGTYLAISSAVGTKVQGA